MRVEIGSFLRLVLGIVAAIVFAYAGNHMRDIHSVSGDSIAEEFYHQVGMLCYGLACVAGLLGIPVNLAIPAGLFGPIPASPSDPARTDVNEPENDAPSDRALGVE